MNDNYGNKLSKTEEINVRCSWSWYNGFAIGLVVAFLFTFIICVSH